MDDKISEEVLYQLACFNESHSPLSKRISNPKNTLNFDIETLSNMINDPECAEILKETFAHAKFPTSKDNRKLIPVNPTKLTKEYEKGIAVGYKAGVTDFYKYQNIENEYQQEKVDRTIEDNLKKICVKLNYKDEIKEKNFKDGYVDGYVKGLEIEAEKLECGKEDGENFLKNIKETFGDDIKYDDFHKKEIDKFIDDYLNNNVPEKYSGKLYNRWYRNSFKNSIITELTPKNNDIDEKKQISINDTQQKMQHILSRIFQFIYISTYREKTWVEVFENADDILFKAAIGINKNQFKILNKYKIFKEQSLNNFINEFFINESLGKNINKESENTKKYYRNSFNWFGFGLDDKDNKND